MRSSQWSLREKSTYKEVYFKYTMKERTLFSEKSRKVFNVNWKIKENRVSLSSKI